MQPDETVENQDAPPVDAPPATPQPSATAETDWDPSWGPEPLKEHVRNSETVDLEEGAPTRVHLGEKVENWAGEYEERSDVEAVNPDATPSYNPAHEGQRSQFLSDGPGYRENFDVHDYIEAEVVPTDKDMSGYVNPTY